MVTPSDTPAGSPAAVSVYEARTLLSDPHRVGPGEPRAAPEAFQRLMMEQQYPQEQLGGIIARPGTHLRPFST